MAAFVISHVQKAAELIQHPLDSPRQAADSWASMWDFVSKGKLGLSLDRWGDGGRSGVHSQESIPNSKSKRKPSPICLTRWPRVLGYMGPNVWKTFGHPI
jgi:hypothetical protein